MLICLSDLKIKLGWSIARIKEFVEVIRCFNCQDIGHYASACKKDRAERHCYRCGQTGHISSTCQRPEYCRNCQTEGHRTEQISCPKIKAIIRSKLEERASNVINNGQN